MQKTRWSNLRGSEMTGEILIIIGDVFLPVGQKLCGALYSKERNVGGEGWGGAFNIIYLASLIIQKPRA